VEQNRVTKIFFLILFCVQIVVAQTESTAPAAAEKPVFEEVDEGPGTSLKILNGEPNKKRIRRHLSLIAGVKHDEEFQIPNVPLSFKGSAELLEMQRVKGTDIFRMLPTKDGNGIITVHNKKTGQIYLEIRLDIRKQDVEKNLREIQALLVDIEGIEYKIINSKILLDGFVLLPNDLIRIGNVIQQFGDEIVKSLVSLNPLARKKMIEYIARDINNPEITLSAIGDFVKVEGMVNSKDEEGRILNTIEMYLPATVSFSNPGLKNVEVKPRDMKQAQARDFIINNLRLRPAEDKVEPPPKMIQVVVHFVELSDRYSKGFNFGFNPELSTVSAAASGAATNADGSARSPSAFSETVALLSNLLPKINWARNHGFLRVLDTASVLTQDKNPASIDRTLATNSGSISPSTGAAAPPTGGNGTLSLNVTPTIKSERSGLIEMALRVSTVPATGSTIAPTTSINTKISVRDRQSAAFGGIINKKSTNDYGGPSGTDKSIITLNQGKKYEKSNGNFVVFVTPIIKSSASAGVEQIKKKFRMKE
jgi:pilus assembly protein CpaC